MKGILIGHGWHDDGEKVHVPAGMRLEYFAHEHTPMLMSNLLMLLRAGDPGSALHEFAEGEEVQNYHYDAFSDEQMARAEQLNHVPLDTPVFFAPDGGRLCTDVGNCPAAGPHTCDGVFALAAQQNLTAIQFLACRVDVTADPRPDATVELMGEHGVPETTLDDQYKTWIRSFLSLSPAEQDTAWENLDYETQVLVAGDGEMIEWAECHEARSALRQTDPAGAATLVQGLSEPVRLRLFRDYPDYHHLLESAVQFSDEEQRWIQQDFLTQDFQMQAGQWQSFGTDQQLRYLADPQVANWAAAYRVWDYFQLGMEAEYLADMIRQLDDTNRSRLQTQTDLIDHLGGYAVALG
jgi:hypothetical protein